MPTEPARPAADHPTPVAEKSAPAAGIRVVMYQKFLPPRYSGAGLQALLLAGALRRRGIECLFLTDRSPEAPTDYEVDGIEVRTVFRHTEKTGIEVRKCLDLALQREIRRHGRHTVFHAHGAYPDAASLGATARLMGMPSVLKVTLHNSDLDVTSTRLTGKVHHRLLKRQSTIVATSREIEAELEALGIPRSKVAAIPNGVDTERFRPASPERKAAARQKLGLPAPPVPLTLFAGIMIERKNVGWLLDVWEAHRRGGGEGELILAGPARPDPADPLRRRIETITRDPAMRVHWLGRVADMVDAYAAADLFVLPAKSEGMPNVVLESMAAGVPAAVTAISGTRQLLGPEQAGICIPPDDAEALREALRMPTEAPSRLTALGTAARSRVVEVFSIDSVAERYEALYRRIL